jgi:predicted membrane protein
VFFHCRKIHRCRLTRYGVFKAGLEFLRVVKPLMHVNRPEFFPNKDGAVEKFLIAGLDPIVSPRCLQLSSGMPLLNVVLALIAVGAVLWLINTFIPMQGTIKAILNIVVVIAVVLWLLYGFGIINHSGDFHFPTVK